MPGESGATCFGPSDCRRGLRLTCPALQNKMFRLDAQAHFEHSDITVIRDGHNGGRWPQKEVSRSAQVSVTPGASERRIFFRVSGWSPTSSTSSRGCSNLTPLERSTLIIVRAS